VKMKHFGSQQNPRNLPKMQENSSYFISYASVLVHVRKAVAKSDYLLGYDCRSVCPTWNSVTAFGRIL